MSNELLAMYRIFGKKYFVYGCWDKETPENTFDFYDIEDENGITLNLGEPFDVLPSYEQVKDLINTIRG